MNIFLNKKILIYGLGKSGLSAFKFLKNKNEIFLFDDYHLIKKDLLIQKNFLSLKKISKFKFDLIILSPGIDINKCKLSKFLKKNLNKIYSDLDVFYSFYKNDCITITGTNGKSTTCQLMYEVLLNQKFDVKLVGNIGNPILSAKDVKKKTIFIVEASSYQLEYSKIFKSKYAAILNLSPDHIERHKTLNRYVRSKFKLLEALIQHEEAPAFALPKFKFFSPTRCEFKNFEIICLNKKKFPTIKLNGGGDLCLATLDGKLLDYNNVPIVNIPIWNYDTTFRTREVIAEDRARFARAWYRHFNDWSDRGGSTKEEAFEAWFKMVKKRLPRHLKKVELKEHPKFIRSKLESLEEKQFGYDCFGLLDKYKPSTEVYYDYLKMKVKFPNIKLKID